MKFEQYDQVITLIDDPDFPAGTYGVVHGIDSEGIWVEVYAAEDAKSPEDCLLYQEDELRHY
ncbi:MAG: hypothetical protein IJ899_22445 [Blautia sp.]|nr:hypothetical protein [Blautia sp.]